MNAAQVLQEDGVAVVLAEGGRLKVIGLDAIPPERAQKVLTFARENKARLLAELAPPPPQPGKDAPQACRRITPAMLRNFRTACPWLLGRLDVLRGAGWTVKRLFGVSRLRWPYLWGVAWSSAWTSPGWTPSLTVEGFIQWEIREPRRTVYQTVRPGQ